MSSSIIPSIPNTPDGQEGPDLEEDWKDRYSEEEDGEED
jgi:hypothetical protein